MLEYALENGILDLDYVKDAMTKKEQEKIIKNHPFSIWQASDGRWKTRVSDPTAKSGKKIIAKSSEEELLKALYSYYKNADEEQQLKAMTLCELYPKWLEYKKLHTKAHTYITRLHTDWKKYYLGSDIINIPIRKFTKLMLDEWAHKLIQDYNMTKNQYYNVVTIMRQSLDYAVDLEILQMNPFSLVKIDGARLFRKVKKKPNCTQVFSKEELQCITEMAWEDFYNHTKVYELSPLAVLFQFQTGLRIGELCAVRYEDIESPNYIHVQRMLRRDTDEIIEHTKSECGDRQVLLTSTAKKIIACAKERQEELQADCGGYIFSINGRSLIERPIADLYAKYCKKMETSHKSSHKARKTYISALIDGQVNINTVREMAGHSDERTTLGNYCFDRKVEQEKMIQIESALA